MENRRRFIEYTQISFGNLELNLPWRNPVWGREQLIDENDVDDLCTYLRTIPSLYALNLGGHPFSEESIIQIISVTTVSELKISAKNMAEAGWKALANNHHLKVIDLSCSQLTDERLIDLLNAFKTAGHVSAQKLILESNGLTDQGALAVARFCEYHPQITIDLIGNFIGELGARALLSVRDKVSLIPQYKVDAEDKPRDTITKEQWAVLSNPREEPYEQWMCERNADLHPNFPSLKNFSFYVAKKLVKSWVEAAADKEQALAALPNRLEKLPPDVANELIEKVETEFCRPK